MISNVKRKLIEKTYFPQKILKMQKIGNEKDNNFV